MIILALCLPIVALWYWIVYWNFNQLVNWIWIERQCRGMGLAVTFDPMVGANKRTSVTKLWIVSTLPLLHCGGCRSGRTKSFSCSFTTSANDYRWLFKLTRRKQPPSLSSSDAFCLRNQRQKSSTDQKLQDFYLKCQSGGYIPFSRIDSWDILVLNWALDSKKNANAKAK